MQVMAKLNYLRMAPRKVRLVADLIRRKKIAEARAILSFTVKNGSKPLQKLLLSAVANAKNNFQLDPENLYISKITVDEGPKLKRWMPRARGQAYEIQKKTSHITIILDEIKTGKKVKKARKAAKEKKATKEAGETSEAKITEAEKEEKKEFIKPKTTPRTELEKPKPKVSGFRRIFRRKAF